eukprot:545917-Pelagomonas_calceolata.AAC.8
MQHRNTSHSCSWPAGKPTKRTAQGQAAGTNYARVPAQPAYDNWVFLLVSPAEVCGCACPLPGMQGRPAASPADCPASPGQRTCSHHRLDQTLASQALHPRPATRAACSQTLRPSSTGPSTAAQSSPAGEPRHSKAQASIAW